jgi:hypothetical protein
MAELFAQQAEREAGILSRANSEVPLPKSNQSQSGERNLCVMTNLQFKGSWNEVKGKLKHYDFALDLSAAGLHIAI